jgi:hypothetical protein
MTERLWWHSTDPNPLLVFLQGGSSERKRRLLACTFGRDLGKEIKDVRFWEVIATGERWADEDHEPDVRFDVIEAAYLLHDEAYAADDFGTSIATSEALSAIMLDPLYTFIQRIPTGWGRLREIGRDVADRFLLGVSYRKRKPYPPHWCGFIRDIFGNPFRPVAFSPAWKTDTAVALARQMYDSRDFGAMPILADALQDAGCDSDDILSHCRGDGPHVRGCWVVDLVLGKE